MFIIPWWVFLVILGILFSGYMSFHITMKERKIEQSYIEREGNVYMERMKKEREKRNMNHEIINEEEVKRS
ncbi:sporulation YhaL family protein [Bacillus sp. SM2101]|uniref:sporulation YhaL family protein n=1 Tax=Bacillus sp. SM2101 TaxID=2805366 RepID=UPI001BDEF296|nr:sporulation YhaL family protein [Bacillus sp. SM2101]